jgi:hypothetical protein
MMLHIESKGERHYKLKPSRGWVWRQAADIAGEGHGRNTAGAHAVPLNLTSITVSALGLRNGNLPSLEKRIHRVHPVRPAGRHHGAAMRGEDG